jgi:hypothetical protein
MKLQLASALGLLAAVTVSGPAVYADTYSSVTTTDSMPLERTTTVETSPTIVREERPVIVEPPANNTTIIKKKSHAHHLLNLGVVKVF